MSQRITSFYRLVTLPSFYKLVQSLLGAEKAKLRYMEEVIQPRRGERVLDVGCGPASLLPFMPEMDYTGIDLNAQHIAYAKQHYGTRGRFLEGDATKVLDSNEPPFDLIIVSALLHHLTDREAKSLLRQLCAMLRPGGRIITMDSIWLERQHPVAWLFNKLDSGLNVRTADGYMALLEGLAVTVETKTYHDFFRVPYDHFCMTILRTGDTAIGASQGTAST